MAAQRTGTAHDFRRGQLVTAECPSPSFGAVRYPFAATSEGTPDEPGAEVRRRMTCSNCGSDSPIMVRLRMGPGCERLKAEPWLQRVDAAPWPAGVVAR
jgi:hypothetical protein